jgi:CubicO group peptidase (beta-lactamase class C family)
MHRLGYGLGLLALAACAGCSTGPAAPALFDVPRMEGVTIDGKADDWGGRGFRVGALAGRGGELVPVESLDTRLRLGWDERGLLVLVATTDDEPRESADTGSLWQGDSVELFYADRQGGSEKVQCVVAPGLDPRHGALRQQLYDQRRDAKLKKTEPTATAARTKTRGGYVMEVLLPWANLGIRPVLGREVGFQIYVNDADAQGRAAQLIWYPRVNTHADSTAMHRLRLAERPSPPVTSVASARYESFRRVAVQVLATEALAGKPVAVMHAGTALARGVLHRRGERALAALRAPMPPRGKPYAPLTVLVDGQAAARLELPDADQQRARAFMEASPAFQPAVFSGEAFPTCQFERPLLVEELIGPYAIDVTFYDNDGRVVTTADKPGRYGAVVKVRADDGRSYTRFRTLFRQPRPLDWWAHELKGSIELPGELGIDPAVAARRREDVNRHLKQSLAERTWRGDELAKLLAGLYETRPDEDVTVYNDWQSRDRQWWVGLKRKLNGNDRRFARPFVCPRPIEGKPAPVLRPGTAAEAGMKGDAAAKLDALLTEWAADSDQAFIACVARRGVIVLHKAYGTRDGQAMTTHAKSWMASLTKLLQGTCMMMLVDQGLVDLDENVGKYLPELAGAKVATPMTVRHLFTHTAGMWGHWGDDVNDLEHVVAEYYPHLEIGRKHEYNGMSLSLASKIIEQVSGEALPAFYKRHLLDPLGCAETDVTTSSYDAQSTAMDMARIGQMLLNAGAYGDKRFFSRQTLERMLPTRLTKVLGPDTKVVWGIGCVWMSSEVLGERTFGHGSAASATLRIGLANDLVVSMTRNTAGRNFGKYHERFLKLVADSMVGACDTQGRRPLRAQEACSTARARIASTSRGPSSSCSLTGMVRPASRSAMRGIASAGMP